MSRQTRADVLAEAEVLERMGGEWTLHHAAAFCTLSESSLWRSDCPRVEKAGIRGIKGKGMVRFIPAKVREWNDQRTKQEAAA